MPLLPDDDRISAYLDGELASEERRVFERELEASPEVARLISEFTGMSMRLRQLPMASPVGVDLTESVLAGLPVTPVTAAQSLAASGTGTLNRRMVSSGTLARRTMMWRTMMTVFSTAAVFFVAVGTMMWFSQWGQPQSGGLQKIEMSMAANEKAEDTLDASIGFSGVRTDTTAITPVPLGLAKEGDDVIAVLPMPATAIVMSNLQEMDSAVMAFMGGGENPLMQEFYDRTQAASVTELNRTNKWSNTLSADLGNVVVDHSLAARDLIGFLCPDPQQRAQEEPVVSIDVYCQSVTVAAIELQTNCDVNGIVLQNTLVPTLAESSQHQESKSDEDQKNQPSSSMVATSIDDKTKTRGQAGAGENESIVSRIANDSPVLKTEVMRSGVADDDGDLFVLIDAPASQMFRFLVDTEQSNEVSELSINSEKTQAISQRFAAVKKTPFEGVVRKENADGVLEEPRASEESRFSYKAKDDRSTVTEELVSTQNMRALQPSTTVLSEGADYQAKIPPVDISLPYLADQQAVPIELGNKDEKLQVKTPESKNVTSFSKSAISPAAVSPTVKSPAVTPPAMTSPAGSPGLDGEVLNRVMEGEKQTGLSGGAVNGLDVTRDGSGKQSGIETTMSAEPRMRVMLVLKQQRASPVLVPPPPHLPEDP